MVSGILTASIFLLDLSLELGVAGGVAYIVLVLFSLWGDKRSYIFWAGVTGTIFTWLGYLFSPPGGENWKVLANRFLALFVIWIAVIICRSFQKSQDTIRANAIRLSNESRIRAILNNAGEGIYGLDMEGNTSFINPAAAQMLGYSAEELIGKPQHALIHHSRKDGTPYPRNECHIYAAFRDGTIHRETNEVFWRKDGSSFSVEYVSMPIRENGKLVGAVVTFRDTTAEKREKYRNILRYNLTKVLAEAQTADEIGRASCRERV